MKFPKPEPLFKKFLKPEPLQNIERERKHDVLAIFPKFFSLFFPLNQQSYFSL
jgi:hypothetical protein